MSPPPNLLALAGLGLLLGFRHAFEPDHLAAVSTLATRQGRLLDACRLGLAWALGHTASVGVVVGAIVLFGLLAVSVSLASVVRLASTRGARWASVLHVGSALASVVVGVALAGRVASQ